MVTIVGDHFGVDPLDSAARGGGTTCPLAKPLYTENPELQRCRVSHLHNLWLLREINLDLAMQY